MAELSAARNNTKHLEALAQTMAVPRDHRPMRMPTFPAMERTAVTAHLSTANLRVPAGNSLRGFVSRSPTYPVWATYDPGPNLVTNNVNITTTPNVSLGIRMTVMGDVWVIDNDYWTGLNSAGAYNSMVNSQLWPVGVTGDDTVWMYHPAGAVANVGCIMAIAGGTGTSKVVTLTFELEVFNGSIISREEYDVTATVIPGGTEFKHNSTNNFGPWFRLVAIRLKTDLKSPTDDTYYSINSASMGVSGTWSSGQSMFPVVAPPEYTTSNIPYRSTRETALSVLFSNVSSVLNKEGTISAVRVPMSLFRTTGGLSPWGDFTQQSFFTAPHPAERYYGPLEKGLYTYALPDQKTEQFATYVSDQIAAYPVYRLDDSDYVHLLQFSDLDSAGATTLAVQVDMHLEFRTSSSLFQLGYSHITLESYHVAVLSLLKQGVFYENPVHLAAIGNLIRGAVTTLAPVMMPYLRAAVPHVSSMASAATSALMNRAAEKLGSMVQKQVDTSRQQASMPTVESRASSRASSPSSRKKVVVSLPKKKKKNKNRT